MPGTDPIRLGSALSGGVIFQAGSTLTTTDSGIDEAAIKVLYAGGPLPTLAKGTPYTSIFDNNYLAATFLLDKVDVSYLEGKVLGGTLTFVRPNPLLTGRNAAKIFIDSIINYKNFLSPYLNYQISATGQTQDGVFGFPEPTVAVKYNSTTQPGIGSGGLSSLYALPGSSAAAGFPPVPNIAVPYTAVAGVGSVVSYYDGTTFISIGPLSVQTTFNWNINFYANPRGWQLVKLKSDPMAAPTPASVAFYDVEEQWRNSYFFLNIQFISKIP